MAHGKKWVLTPEILDTIKDCAIKGVTEANIARIVGLHPTAFSTKKKEYPEIEEVIKQAQAGGEHEVVGYLWNIIRDPSHRQHFSAICFYLKTKHRWRETEGEQVDKPQIPTGITFTVAQKKETNDES